MCPKSGLDATLCFSEFVEAGVTSQVDPGVGDPVKAIGWGKAGSDMEEFATLHEVDLKVHEMKTEGLICIDSEGGRGVCNGDSGGPLLDDNGHVAGVGK